MTAPGNVDGDATIASSATTPPEEWPTTSIGSPITFATARTSSTSWSIVHGEPVTMSSRYWRRCRRTTRKRGASRAATFPHDLPSSMPGTSCATPVHSAGRTASPSSSRPSAPSSRKRMDRAGAASIDSSWAMMAGTALRSNLACPSSWSRSSPQIRVGSAGCGRRWPGPASAPEGWVGPQQGRCCCWAWTRPLSTRTPTSRAMALLALPKPARGRAILVRADSAGATHAFVDELVGRNLAFSVGFDCDQRVRDAILALPEDAFTPALDPTVGRAVVPGPLSLRAWTLPARAGRRAPGRSAAANDAWLSLVCIAQTLVCWAQALLLDGDCKLAKPKTLRCRLWHVAGRIVRHARRLIVRVDRAWPWATDLVTAFARLRALPARCSHAHVLRWRRVVMARRSD